MGKPETNLTKRIIKQLDLLNNGFFFKIHSMGYHQDGISDILGCYLGKFFALEVKTSKRRNESSRLQLHFQEQVRTAGGTAEVITSWDEAERIIVP